MQTSTPLNTPAARQAVDSIERFGDSAEQTVRTVRERVLPAASRLASQAEDLAQRSISAVRNGGDQLRERTSAAAERGISYVRDEPVKSVLIAAAAGAALVALVQLLSSRRSIR